MTDHKEFNHFVIGYLMVCILCCLLIVCSEHIPEEPENYTTVMIKDNHDKEVRIYDGFMTKENGIYVLNECRLVSITDTADNVE